MGDRQSDGGARAGRRAHPGGTLPDSGAGPTGRVTESLIADAVRPHALDTDAEQRALAAFRAARDAGMYAAVHGSRTRRRDDWRPREHRRARRSLRVTFTLSLAGLTLGGVAFAAIDSVGGSPDGGHAGGQRTQAPAAPAAGTSRTPGPSAPHERPDTAKDTEAHCRAYAKKLDGHGKAFDSTAWQRLIAAAGGEKNVTAYCAEQLEEKPGAAPSASEPGNNGRTAEPGKTAKPEKTAQPQQTDNGRKTDKGAGEGAQEGADKDASQGNGKNG
jgi:hypothetical protein